MNSKLFSNLTLRVCSNFVKLLNKKRDPKLALEKQRIKKNCNVYFFLEKSESMDNLLTKAITFKRANSSFHLLPLYTNYNQPQVYFNTIPNQYTFSYKFNKILYFTAIKTLKCPLALYTD